MDGDADVHASSYVGVNFSLLMLLSTFGASGKVEFTRLAILSRMAQFTAPFIRDGGEVVFATYVVQAV